jgi:S1-C subfamily serine protease
MRKALRNAILLYLVSLNSNAFSLGISSVISFINVSGGSYQNASISVSLNNQLAGTIKTNESLDCTLLSTGRIKLTFEIGDHKVYKTVDIDSGQTYFYKIDCSSDQYHIIYRQDEGSELLSKVNRRIKFIEDGNHPITDKVEQDYSTINFVANRCTDKIAFSIYLNEQLIGSINRNENLEYRMYSAGRISVTIIINSVRLTRTIDVHNGYTYFFEINNWNGKYDLVDEQTGMRYLSKVTNTLKAEENKRQPLISKSYTTEKQGQGTCFLISSQGYLITNYHVIENATEIMIKGIEGDFTTKYSATVIGTDQSNDLALLKLGNKNLKFSNPSFAIRSSGVAQGEKIYAYGYPLAFAMGDEIKLTDGIISAKSGVQGDISKFQLSAAVSPGNSGGPLIDEQGNLIGVIYAKSTIAEAANYAIKASYLESFLKNVEGFEFPNLINSIKDKSLTDKVAELKTFIFIVETN